MTIQSKDFKIHTQLTRKQYVKLLILDFNRMPIMELQGFIIGGSYNITNNSAIRRTCSISMTLSSEKLLPNANSYFWVDRKFQLYMGIEDGVTGEICWYNQGVYVIKSPSTNIQVSNKTLQIAGLDLTALQNGDIAGTLDKNYEINSYVYNDNVKSSVPVPLHQAIRTTIIDLGLEDESRVFIDNTPFFIPYDLKFTAGTTVWNIIDTLTKLYMDYESFYDENGNFIFRKKPILLNDRIEWDFSKYNLINTIQKTTNYNNIKNQIIVRGKLLDNTNNIGLQPNYEIRVRQETQDDIIDKTYIVNNNLCNVSAIVNRTDSEFMLDKLKENKFRTLFVQDDKYYTLEQCKQRANYEFDKHNNLNTTVSLTIIPIYCLTVNQLIQINDIENDVMGIFVINDINGQLAYNGLMTINCSQIYN